MLYVTHLSSNTSEIIREFFFLSLVLLKKLDFTSSKYDRCFEPAVANTCLRPPCVANSSSGWLVVHNWCWTVDRLAKRGLPHSEVCPFCDQAKESINYLLVGCVLPCQVWTSIFQHLVITQLAPDPSVSRFWMLEKINHCSAKSNV